MIYLDNNATTRVPEQVVQAMTPYLSDKFVNPGSFAGAFEGLDQVIERAKTRLARLTGCLSSEYFLTSGATESNNWAIRSLARHCLLTIGEFNLVISSSEHPSVLETAKDLAKDPRVSLRVVSVDDQGRVDIESLKSEVTQDTHLVSIILANNESGVLQNVKELTQVVKSIASGCLFHTDATQAVGKISVRLDGELGDVDLLSFSAHKFHGPKGIGGLFIRNGVEIPPLITGGGQQAAMRSGTENPALAAGLSAALGSVTDDSISKEMAHIRALRDWMEEGILELLPRAKILSKQAERLPNTSLIIMPSLEGEMVVSMLYQAGIITSTGASCSSGSDIPSHVVTGMGIPYGQARNAIRISLSQETTRAEVAALLEAMQALE